ncbi:MAG: hypothetical protein AAF519_00165 [Bacteroidota bacterium]
MKFNNMLNISGWVLLFLSILLYLPTWGGSSYFLVLALPFVILNLLTKNKPRSHKNFLGVVLWVLVALLSLYQTRSIVLHVKGNPEEIYVLTDVCGAPKIHSYFKWNSHTVVDSSFILYTSSSEFDLRHVNFKIKDHKSKNIGPMGTAWDIDDGGSLITLNTKYFDYSKWSRETNSSIFTVVEKT